MNLKVHKIDYYENKTSLDIYKISGNKVLNKKDGINQQYCLTEGSLNMDESIMQSKKDFHLNTI